MSEKKQDAKPSIVKAKTPASARVNKDAFIKRKLDVLNSKDGAVYERAALHVVEVNRKVGKA